MFPQADGRIQLMTKLLDMCAAIRSDLSRQAAARNRLRIARWTYWGLPLVLTLLFRRLWPLGKQGRDGIISAGFSPRTRTLNRLLSLVAKCEPIPQKFLGTSIMAVLEMEGV